MLRKPLFVACASLALVAASLTLPACSLINSGSTLSPSAQVTAAKAEYGFEATYNTAANAYLAALPSLTAAQKAAAKPILAKMYAAVQAARTAESLGDDATITAKAADLVSLAGQLGALIKPAS